MRDKISDWEECKEESFSVKITPNKGKVKSLIDTAEGRINYADEKKEGKHLSYVFEDYYTSLIEMIHALVILEGYKVSNHFCLGFYLRDVLKKDKLFRLFDNVRFKRNSLIYYGKKLDSEEALESIEKCKTIINEVKILIKEEVLK